MTEQESKERKLLLQEVEGLLSLITVPILVVDATGHVIHANQAAEHVWQRSLAVLLTKSLQAFVATSKLLGFVKKGKPLRDFPVEIVDGSGKRLPCLCRLHPLYIDQKPEGAILQFTRQQMETEQEKNRKYVTRYTFADIRGNSEAIIALKDSARKIAKSDSTVLI
ncbi:PAS domain-containing protein, partial [Brevibacillus agri]